MLLAMMKPEFLIAIVSGLITLAASFFVAIYQARTEFRKLARNLEQQYATALFEKRLEVYPVLFKALQDLNHVIEYQVPSEQDLVEFQQQYDRWLASHAILLTPTTAKVVWGYHNYLITLREQYHDSRLPQTVWTEIRNIQVVIGKFLRAELGVFDTIAAGISDLDRPHIQAILDRLHQTSQKLRDRFGY